MTLGYQQEKTRLLLQLRESIDQTVSNANAKVPIGRMGNAKTRVEQAISRLQHQEIVGRVQAGKAGPGWGEAPQSQREEEDGGGGGDKDGGGGAP